AGVHRHGGSAAEAARPIVIATGSVIWAVQGIAPRIEHAGGVPPWEWRGMRERERCLATCYPTPSPDTYVG
ncbi:MAG: hypothetical protein V3R80_01160, partial [Candidatus Tectomicrobia bacterium]